MFLYRVNALSLSRAIKTRMEVDIKKKKFFMYVSVDFCRLAITKRYTTEITRKLTEWRIDAYESATETAESKAGSVYKTLRCPDLGGFYYSWTSWCVTHGISNVRILKVRKTFFPRDMRVVPVERSIKTFYERTHIRAMWNIAGASEIVHRLRARYSILLCLFFSPDTKFFAVFWRCFGERIPKFKSNWTFDSNHWRTLLT